jgi:hypothetical protein
MLRIDPMAVLSSPLSGPLWPRCAVAPVPGTAFAPMPPWTWMVLSLGCAGVRRG